MKYVVGIDEVGRGALAGKVYTAALALPRNFSRSAGSRTAGQFSIAKFQKISKLKLRDSKKLNPKQREAWFEYVKSQKIFYALASLPADKIDKINISRAANLAATKAFNKLISNFQIPISKCEIFLDGGLHLEAPNHKPQITKYKQKTIIKGDEKIPAISLASIVAKVSRDKEMIKLHKKYPKYGFHNNKGYGTKEHFGAIKKHGPSKIHRLTFLKKMR